MSLGFNSDVRVGSDVFHVQTESYGEPQYTIVTLVYHRGRILHRRNSNYSDLAAAPGFPEQSLNGRVEGQHRAVIDEIRKGAIAIPQSSDLAKSPGSHGIQLRLRNAHSWFAAGQAVLDVEVIQRRDNSPAGGVKVEAFLTGSNDDAHYKARTGMDGLARVEFAVPSGVADGAELVIRAETSGSEATDEIRFVLKAKTPGSSHKANTAPKKEREA